MGLYTKYEVAGAGLSSGLWGNCPLDRMMTDPGVGYGFIDDFTRWVNVAAGAQAAYGLYRGFADTGGLVADSEEDGGVINFSSDGDDEGASLGMLTAPFRIDLGKGEFWFEARLKTSTITDTKHGFFIGLIGYKTTAMTALSATVPIAAAGTLADENIVGFHRLEGDGDALDTVYKADGVTQVTVKADAATIAADTYFKVGMHFNPRTNKMEFWFNGAMLPDTKTIPAADGTDFPNDEPMGLVMAVLNATATTPGSTDMDWWAAAQLRV